MGRDVKHVRARRAGSRVAILADVSICEGLLLPASSLTHPHLFFQSPLRGPGGAAALRKAGEEPLQARGLAPRVSPSVRFSPGSNPFVARIGETPSYPYVCLCHGARVRVGSGASQATANK